MNIYRVIGNSIGTSEAVDLGERLTEWHDAMVTHERKRRLVGADCDDRCPHAEARDLWLAAVDVFGDRALELPYLVKHGATRNTSVTSGVPAWR